MTKKESKVLRSPRQRRLLLSFSGGSLILANVSRGQREREKTSVLSRNMGRKELQSKRAPHQGKASACYKAASPYPAH
ncbi:hypothetical protein GOP47_0015505 [Adiantum capillus-veneris]|uniref:Uncharacterized protein n=1 Tax=Adiantum capillus-veneris TaxID=13818 RepID=A0A9D4ZBQ4_ADICA|nr:hypothetical protein GOP47_0015505 [Adiantum capillus-veneris]